MILMLRHWNLEIRKVWKERMNKKMLPEKRNRMQTGWLSGTLPKNRKTIEG